MSVAVARLTEIRKKKGLTLKELAKTSGVSISALKKISAGITKNPNIETVRAIANAMNCTLSELDAQITQGVLSDKTSVNGCAPGLIPVLGKVISCELYSKENIKGYIACDFKNNDEYFCLSATGNNMIEMGINEGDMIVVRRQNLVENGDVALVVVGGELTTVRRFHRLKNLVILSPQSDNPNHMMQIYNLKETTVNVIGKVVELRRKF